MKAAIKNMLRWARITAPGSDDKQFATQQMEYLGKVADGLIVFPYGLHGNVPADALALMFAIQGNPDNRAAIAWTPKDRPTLKDGEVAFYHPPTGGLVVWRQNGNLEITTAADIKATCANAEITATTKITLTAPTINLVGDLNVTGDTAFTGAVTANGKDISDTHGHTQANDSAGDTEAAISGVT